MPAEWGDEGGGLRENRCHGRRVDKQLFHCPILALLTLLRRIRSKIRTPLQKKPQMSMDSLR